MAGKHPPGTVDLQKLMKRYLFSLDYLRGFAALSVCLFHFTDKREYLPDSDFLKLIFSPGHYGVEVFFIISGFVIPYSMAKGDYRLGKFLIFLKKRFIRIEPPYLVCVLLALALNYATTLSPVYVGKQFKVDYQQLFYHVGYLNAFMGKDWLNQVFWTLAIEFQYYLLMALIFPLISHKNRIIWILSLLSFNLISFQFDRNYIFNFSVFFTVGILAYRYLIDRLNIWETIIVSIATLAFLHYRYSYNEMLVTILTVSIIFLPVASTRFSTFFGEISYSLYLLHFPIGLRLISLTQRFTDIILLRYVMVLMALVLSICVAFYYNKFIERPFKRLSQRIRYNPEEQTGKQNDHRLQQTGTKYYREL
jgi:peptidoglycan/LPS O-acetylase OafA/YrhL